jgi:four helix bundle protein
MKGYKDLFAWQVGMDLVEEVYKLTELFPVHEKFGLSSQMRRAVVSIPSNISEGYRRKTSADYSNFLHIAFGSASELETQVMIAVRLKYLSREQCHPFNQMLDRELRLLNGLITSESRV